jgi:hypothetical protein
MNRGWVPISEIVIDDLIAQLNRQTGKLEYVNPLETLVFDHIGGMYEVETQGVSQKVTLNHRMWVQKRDSPNYELIEAKRYEQIKSCDTGLPLNFAYEGKKLIFPKRYDEFKRVSGKDIDFEGKLDIKLAKKNIEVLKNAAN